MAMTNNHACECLDCGERYRLLREIHDWLVCHPVTTAEDMPQSFPDMQEKIRRALDL